MNRLITKVLLFPLKFVPSLTPLSLLISDRRKSRLLSASATVSFRASISEGIKHTNHGINKLYHFGYHECKILS